MKSLIIAASVLLSIMTAHAGTVTLPWSTSFDCADVTQGVGGAYVSSWPNCDGLTGVGSWGANGQGEQITSAANNPLGPGRAGQRQWNGDGVNVVSGSMQIDFTPVTEIYIRWYMRYQLGFAWSPLSYDKTLWISGSIIPEIHGSDNWNFFTAGTNHDIAGAGFATMNGGSTGDGQFHCYEIHMKVNAGANDDIGEVWLDGVYKGSVTGFDYTGGQFGGLQLGDNQSSPANGANAYLDYDDYAVQTTGPIGCLSTSSRKHGASGGFRMTGTWRMQ